MFDVTKIKPISDEPFEFGPMQTKWLEALESGEWKQAQRILMRVGFSPNSEVTKSYCCLGVLCELAGLEWLSENVGVIDYGFRYGGHTSNGYLPAGFEGTVGLRSPQGDFKAPIRMDTGDIAHSLAEMNDLGSMSFAEIAAYIRHDPHNVFTHSA